MSDIKKILVRIGATTEELDRKLGESRNKINAFSNQINKIGGLIAGAFTVSKVTQFLTESSKLAGVYEGIEAAFLRLNKPDLLDELRKATRGTISDLELMRGAVRAENFKVPLDRLATFFEFATKRAAQTGESVDYLVKSIVDGIGRKSTLVMDNLGISAAELQREIQKVGDFGEASANIIERELTKAGDVALTFNQHVEQMKVKWQNLKVVIGTELNKRIIELTNSIIKLRNNFADLYNTSVVFRAFINGLGAQFDQLFKKITFGFRFVGKNMETLGQLFMAVFKGEFGKIPDIIKDLYKTQYNNIKDLGGDVFQAYKDGFDRSTKDFKAIDLIPEIAIEKAKNKAGKLGKEIGGEIGEAIQSPEWEFKLPDDSKHLEGLISGWDEAPKLIEHIGEEFEKMKLKGEDTAYAITDAFAYMAEGMGEGFDEFASNFGNTVKKIIGALLGWAVGEMIVKGIKASETAGPLALFLAPALGAAGAGIAKALFSSLVPSFAGGGLVTAPTLAMVGDNPSHREAIIPLDQGMGFGGGRFEIVGKVRGKDLYWSLKNYEQFLQNT